MEPKRILIQLEQEFTEARAKNLIAGLWYNVHLPSAYMQIDFKPNTTLATKKRLVNYIKKNYTVLTADLIDLDKSLYITFDFWDRFS